jgi:hypothetical protein
VDYHGALELASWLACKHGPDTTIGGDKMAVKTKNYYDNGDDRRNRTGGNDEILCKMWIDAATTETNFAVNTAVKKYRDSKEQIDYLVTLDSILLRYQEIVTQTVAEHGMQAQAIADEISALVVAGGRAVP